MKYFFPLLWFVILIPVSLNAQVDRDPPETMEAPVMRVNSPSRIYGKLLADNTQKGIQYASVQLFIRTQNRDSAIAAQLSKPNGEFSFDNLPVADSFRLVISALDYGLFDQFITPQAANVPGSDNFQRDMGNIILNQEVKSLGEVVVTAERPALEMGIDKRIFNADQSIISKGGTAVDLMKNIPAVSVDVEGNVELRNASPQIFVDGRPTILTLDQIPADNIDRVELITNPSAKYDAASTGGIINIILKKNRRVGLNGLASVTGGHPGILGGNLNLNLRQGKLNFFLTGGYNRSGGLVDGESYRENKDNGITTDYFDQSSHNERLRRFASVRFGLDYFIDNRNTLTISQSYVNGGFTGNESQDQQYFDVNRNLDRYGFRTSEGRYGFTRHSTQANFTHKFPETGKELNASANFNYGDGTDASDILNLYYNPDGSSNRSPTQVRNEGWNDNSQSTYQIDFVDPNGDDSKIEMGLRSYINKRTSTFNAFSVDNGSETKLSLSNNYTYREMVNAFYFTYTGKIKSIGYQAGIRAEHSNFEGELIDSNRKFGYEYPTKIRNIWDAFFPSLYLSKDLSEDVQVQLNFSRRIRRPNFWNLNPFVDINDPVNIQRGNPELRPEYTNSFEFNYSKQFENRSSFLGAIYYRNNVGDITRYSDTISTEQYLQLNNAGIDPNAILNTFINAQSTNRLGTEFTLQQKFSPKFDITPTLEFQYRKVNAQIGDLNLDNEGFSWEFELMANYKILQETNPNIFNKMSFQFSGEYESAEVIPQGRREPQYSVDLAMRKDFLENDKGTFTFSINDVFNTNRWASIYDTENFYQESYRRRNVRNFRITFSYKFGDADFTLGRRNGGNRDDDDD